MASEVTEAEIEKAAAAALAVIDGNDLAGGDVPRETSIEFYRQLAQLCEERADTIETELEAEATDAGDGDDEDDSWQWDTYERALLDPINANAVQRQETRRGFYAGAHAFLALITENTLDVSDDEGADFMGSLAVELRNFAAAEVIRGNVSMDVEPGVSTVIGPPPACITTGKHNLVNGGSFYVCTECHGDFNDLGERVRVHG